VALPKDVAETKVCATALLARQYAPAAASQDPFMFRVHYSNAFCIETGKKNAIFSP